MACVYIAINLVNGKRYIGATSLTFQKRRARHLYRAKIGDTGCPRFYDAIRKYGPASFHWEIIAHSANVEEAFKCEAVAVELIRPEYNAAPGGNRGPSEPPNKIKVIRLEDGEIFQSMKAAADAIGMGVACMSETCNGGQNTAGGYHFVLYKEPLSATVRLKMILDMDSGVALRRRRRTGELSHYAGITDGRDANGRSAAGPMKNARPVICLTDGREFPSASAAARHYDVPRSAIIQLCAGNSSRKSVSNKKFSYLNKE